MLSSTFCSRSNSCLCPKSTNQSHLFHACSWIPFYSTESAVPTGTRGAPPSRSSSSPSSPSCSRPGPLGQKLSSRLAESYFRSAPRPVCWESKSFLIWFPTQSIPLYHTKHIEIHLVTWSPFLLYISRKHWLELCSIWSPWPRNPKDDDEQQSSTLSIADINTLPSAF